MVGWLHVEIARMGNHRGGYLMDTFVYRIRTDGNKYICEVQQDERIDDTWRRVCFQSGRVIHTSNSTLNSVSMGELFDSERELLKVIESVVGTSARRVREWRTV